MKKLLITVSAIVLLALAATFTGLPYYLGIKAEQSLAEQQQLLAQSNLLTIESHRYERGWFSATETTVIRLKPTLLHNIRPYLPENLKTVLNEPITLVSRVRHGPFAGSLTPVRAQIDTEFQYRPEAAKVLARFFGDQAPVSMRNTVYLSGNGTIDLAVPAFDYEELSGIALDWKGLSGHTDYSSGFNNYTHEYTAPALHIKLADQGDAAFENLHIRTETTDGKNRLALGNSSFKLDKFSMQWKQGVDYNVKLNELVNLVTNLQIGAFINPTGTIAPANIVVDKLQFDTHTGEEGKWINSEGRFQFENLTYGDEQYGPLDINIAAEHLDAQGLLAIKNKLAELTSKEMSEEQIRRELLQTAKTDAAGLFTQNPVLKVKTFSFKMPEGTVDVKGQLSFNNLNAADMNDFAAMIRKTQAQFDMNIPQKLLEKLAINQAGSLFSVNAEDLAEGRASLDDINETLRLMVDSTIQSMQREGYLTLNNGIVSTRIDLAGNSLQLNNKVFESEPEPDFSETDMLPENTASEPAIFGASEPETLPEAASAP
ncbi:YdgA family protein [Uruburuella testudinis]|uniref:YdgA family protein n=1 Tax=Uruburuella testudinis TaxID=1282863 RepID=A0ABY4DQ60_9NEIS|nr:YdgA family protein [Uruburuella testudinis]UOO81197.1 YdgA family protein [Uruburuella testudinis]